MDKKMEEGNSTNSKTQLVIVFLIGFLLGLLVGPLFMGDSATPEEVGSGDNMEDVTKPEGTDGDSMDEVDTVEPGLNSVSVSNQLAGDRVMIDAIEFAEGGWAVVHESIDGAPANALGAQRFDAGEQMNATVELLRGTETGNMYFIILYQDNGDGEFSLKDDTPFQETGGNTISATFEAIHLDRKN